jgi:hypothetical protein
MQLISILNCAPLKSNLTAASRLTDVSREEEEGSAWLVST